MRKPLAANVETVKFIDNRGAGSHETALKVALKSADQIYISIAFLKDRALHRLLPVLCFALKRGATARILVGTDFYLTQPAALNTLHLLLKPFHQRVSAFLIQPGLGVFHPKVYCAVRDQNVTMLVGSANLTDGGLEDNFEASLVLNTHLKSHAFQSFKAGMKAIEVSKCATKLDPLAIGAYQADYEIYQKHTRPAERKARAAIKNQPKLDLARLRPYAAAYRASDHEQKDWTVKQSNYREARRVLDKLLAKPPATAESFLRRYEQLVGASGGIKLWHSGSIFRLKNQVATHFGKFLNMLRAIRGALGRSPDHIFDLAMSHATNIQGLGPNVVTEIFNTYSPTQYPVLNNNPISSLRQMGMASFPHPALFKPQTYSDYAEFLLCLGQRCHFKDLSQTDHFLNYVYWKHVKRGGSCDLRRLSARRPFRARENERFPPNPAR